MSQQTVARGRRGHCAHRFRAVAEGPQFRMGTIDFKGFSEADRTALLESWKLKAGEVYDTINVDRFFRDLLQIGARLLENKFLGRFQIAIEIDRAD